MAGAPRPKKTTVKKKVTVKKTPKPGFLRQEKPRPARDIKPGDPRQSLLDRLKQGPNQPQGPERSLYKEKIGPQRPGTSSNVTSTVASTVAKNVMTRLPGIGRASALLNIFNPSFMSNKYGGAAGPNSNVPGQAQKAVEKRFKREIRQGPELAKTGVKTGIIGSNSSPQPIVSKTGTDRPTYLSSNKNKASAVNLTGTDRPTYLSSNKAKKASGNISKVGGPGGARAYEDAKTNVNAKKSVSAKAASVVPAQAAGGESKAASARSKTKRRTQTKTQREALYMETRKG